jgi:hypothetical protein
VTAIVFVSVVVAIMVTIFAIRSILFPPPFEPVVLSAGEEQQLAAKLDVLEQVGSPVGSSQESSPSPQPPTAGVETGGALTPEKYSEEGLSRQIDFSEREINAMIAKNTDLADKLAVDLAQDLVSLKLLIPLDPGLPVLGGKTLRVNAGAELAYREARPVVVLKGISIMGVPMPNAWMGGLKNIDLVREFGGGEGFWKTFSDGVESISVVDGVLTIRLKD